MTHYQLPRALVGGVLLLAACDPASVFEGCTDDLLTRVDPRSRTLRVGESYTAAASAWGCRGTKRLSDEWRYFAADTAADTAIVRVDSVTGRVTARADGATDVGARGAAMERR